MTYDYLINFIYPNLWWMMTCLIVLMVFTGAAAVGLWSERSSPYRSPVIKLNAVLMLLLLFLVFMPDKDFMVFHFGDPRMITSEQRQMMQEEYDAQYEKSKQLLMECLINGQKQPNSTVFNDTNEVVKTCYEVARFKF